MYLVTICQNLLLVFPTEAVRPRAEMKRKKNLKRSMDLTSHLSSSRLERERARSYLLTSSPSASHKDVIWSDLLRVPSAHLEGSMVHDKKAVTNRGERDTRMNNSVNMTDGQLSISALNGSLLSRKVGGRDESVGEDDIILRLRAAVDQVCRSTLWYMHTQNQSLT